MPLAGRVGTEQLTVSTSEVSLSQYVPNGDLKSMGAEITVDAGAILWTADPDGDPATDGHLAPEASSISLFGFGMVKWFRAVRSGGVDATITVSYAGDASP